MTPIDRPHTRHGLLPCGQRREAPAGYPRAEFVDLQDDDPLAPARGAVNGVLWGTILWALIGWSLF